MDLVDCADVSQDVLEQEQLEHLGTIAVKIFRYQYSPKCKKQDRESPEDSGSDSEDADDDQQISKVTEKSLKGKGISHRVK